MNMKDAFRFQNKLQTLMGTAQDILSSSRNITTVICTPSILFSQRKIALRP